MNTTLFQKRHIGPNESDKKLMLKSIGLNSLDELINETIPADIRLQGTLNLDAPMSEYEYLNHIEELSKKILNETGVALTPGTDFDKKFGHRTMRLAFSSERQKVIEAVIKLKKWFAQNY